MNFPAPVPCRVTSLRCRAFSLIEILLCILLIAVLAGLILPAVRGIRSSADRVRCSSNLRQVCTLIREGSVARAGFGPVLGQIALCSPVNGSESFVRALGDPHRTRYRYQDFELWPGRIIPVTLEQWLAPPGSYRTETLPAAHVLRCPSAAESTRTGASALAITGSATLSVGFQWMAHDYASNAYVFAFREQGVPSGGAPFPKGGRIHAAASPATLVMFADARQRDGVFQFGGDQAGWPRMAAELNATPGPELDFARHRGRANVAFADGHVESITPSAASACRLIPPTGVD